VAAGPVIGGAARRAGWSLASSLTTIGMISEAGISAADAGLAASVVANVGAVTTVDGLDGAVGLVVVSVVEAEGCGVDEDGPGGAVAGTDVERDGVVAGVGRDP